jgi:hypothetical protein
MNSLFFHKNCIFTILNNYLFNDKGSKKVHIFPKMLASGDAQQEIFLQMERRRGRHKNKYK